mmetsp:Transcript_68456/g.165563  ORF Transcript_68456/g.165563 Transcript_68456/m.165563 type:complete len:230 (-) Transcript_68456:464-1153(-)
MVPLVPAFPRVGRRRPWPRQGHFGQSDEAGGLGAEMVVVVVKSLLAAFSVRLGWIEVRWRCGARSALVSLGGHLQLVRRLVSRPVVLLVVPVRAGRAARRGRHRPRHGRGATPASSLLSNGVFLRGKAIESGEAVGFVRVGLASVARLSRRHPTRLSRAEGGGEAARGPGPEVAEALAQAYLGEEVEGQQTAREEQHRLIHLQLKVVDPVQRSQQRDGELYESIDNAEK